MRNSPDYDPQAKAEQQYYSKMNDTADYEQESIDDLTLRPHRPISIEIHQTSYAWGGEYTKRFVLVDWWIINIGTTPIQKACVALVAEPRVWWWPEWPFSNLQEHSGDNWDDICGFIFDTEGISSNTRDTIRLAWAADNDGNPDPDKGGFIRTSSTGAAGVRVLRSPELLDGSRNPQVAFNWWARDPASPQLVEQTWGPRRASDRTFYRNSRGMPIGDRGNYHMMTNGEIDYDQAYTAYNMEAKGWQAPPSDDDWKNGIGRGSNVYFMLSTGPLKEILPGDSVPFTVAFISGKDFHRYPNNIENFEPLDPSRYLNNLDFEDLIANARWADWVFDNPGVDTDGDGNRGRAYLVNCDEQGCDSVFYKGDGVPDWHGPSAPPPPELEVITMPARVIVRWSGEEAETFIDPFSQQIDFEGYRVYLGKFDQDDEYSLVASWDREDYKRLAYDPETRRWKEISYPLTLDEWPTAMNDDDFNVLDYTSPELAYAYRDSVLDTIRNEYGDIVATRYRDRYSHWVPEDGNRINTYLENDRLETNLIQQIATHDTVVAGQSVSYGTYEFSLSGLNPSVPLFVTVTAFDYGDFLKSLPPLESPQTRNSVYAEFINSSDVVVDSNLKVSVFPNPYKSSYAGTQGTRTTYYLEGYEGRGVVDFAEQDRRIHFINLPDTAIISIYSLDGDLIRRIHHPDPYLTTYSSSVGWDLISRNTQAVVSGIYIWKVDSKLGSQTGKLVIIK